MKTAKEYASEMLGCNLSFSGLSAAQLAPVIEKAMQEAYQAGLADSIQAVTNLSKQRIDIVDPDGSIKNIPIKPLEDER